MSRQFIVKSDPVGAGWHAWFRLYVYDTDAHLQRAAHRYTLWKDIDWSSCQGCFHPRISFSVSDSGKWIRTARTAYLGVMRLSLESCNPAIVIHESCHAAIQYVNALKLQSGYMVGNSNLASEEPLCYAVQEFSMAVSKCMGYIEEIPA